METETRFSAALIGPEQREGARMLAQATGHAHHDVLVVLGSGLSSCLETWGTPVATMHLSDLPDVMAPVADGHEDLLHSYCINGVRVLVALGRTHLYEGKGARAVTALTRIAVASGVDTAVLCNANGCLRQWELGDVMAIEDHMNLSGSSPFDGPLFLDVATVWDRELTDVLSAQCQRRGVYAFLRGPEYQTRAETQWLASTRADCVGMSTVFEALTLHALGVRVAGMSVVSDLSFAEEATDPGLVVEAAARAGTVVREGVEAVLSSR